MLTEIIGRKGVIKLEKKVDPVKFQILQATLAKLKVLEIVKLIHI